MLREDIKIWVIYGDKAGQRNSSIGVAEKISPNCEKIQVRQIDADGSLEQHLANRFGRIIDPSQPVNFANVEIEWPDIVISSGPERNSEINAEIKKLSGGKTMAVNINYPKLPLVGQFDIVAADKHARFRAVKHQLFITGVPHKITPEKIAAAKEEMQPLFDSVLVTDKPIFLAMIGGNIGPRYQLSIDGARDVGRRIREVVEREGGQLLATNSPRISVEAWRAMREEFEPVASLIYDCRAVDIKNPLMAMMGQNLVATIVTEDSISMCCEAGVRSGRVHILDVPELGIPYYRQIHQDLYDQGHARPFSELEQYGLLIPWDHSKPPLDEASRFAEFVIEIVDKKRAEQSNGVASPAPKVSAPIEERAPHKEIKAKSDIPSLWC